MTLSLSYEAKMMMLDYAIELHIGDILNVILYKIENSLQPTLFYIDSLNEKTFKRYTSPQARYQPRAENFPRGEFSPRRKSGIKPPNFSPRDNSKNRKKISG